MPHFMRPSFCFTVFPAAHFYLSLNFSSSHRTLHHPFSFSLSSPNTGVLTTSLTFVFLLSCISFPFLSSSSNTFLSSYIPWKLLWPYQLRTHSPGQWEAVISLPLPWILLPRISSISLVTYAPQINSTPVS